MNIELRFFGRPRERLDTPGESADVPDDISTVADLLAWLRLRGDAWSRELNEDRVRCAVNQSMAGLSSRISERDEVAIFSPISGG